MSSTRSMTVWLLALCVAPAAFAQNILLVVGDDLGVDNITELFRALLEHGPGETVDVSYIRDGEVEVIIVTLGESPN